MDEIKKFVDDIINNIGYFEMLIGQSLRKNKMLRVSLWKDEPGYMLVPHPDSTYKLLTMQLYLPRTSDEDNIGTMFYDQNQLPVKQVPFTRNCGYMFVPCREKGRTTYHGIEGKVSHIRHSVVINIFDKVPFQRKMLKKGDSGPSDDIWYPI